MKTTISITGQTGGNFKLKNAIQTVNCEVSQRFNNFLITFRTKKEAIKALSEGYQYMKRNDLFNPKTDNYMRGYCLTYDASRAVICE